MYFNSLKKYLFQKGHPFNPSSSQENNLQLGKVKWESEE